MIERIGKYMNPDELQRFLHERAEKKLYAQLAAERNQALAFYERWGIKPIAGGSTAAAYSVASASPFAATAGAKTALAAIAPAGHGLAMTEFGASFDGVTSSAVPAVLDVVTSTQATAGTSGETPTITQIRGRVTSGSAPTGGSKYSAQNTVLVRHKVFYIPQYNGTFVYQFPLGREMECDSSAGTIKALCIRIDVSANVNFMGWQEVEAVG